MGGLTWELTSPLTSKLQKKSVWHYPPGIDNAWGGGRGWSKKLNEINGFRVGLQVFPGVVIYVHGQTEHEKPDALDGGCGTLQTGPSLTIWLMDWLVMGAICPHTLGAYDV